jgi:hypothetical protein
MFENPEEKGKAQK